MSSLRVLTPQFDDTMPGLRPPTIIFSAFVVYLKLSACHNRSYVRVAKPRKSV